MGLAMVPEQNIEHQRTNETRQAENQQYLPMKSIICEASERLQGRKRSREDEADSRRDIDHYERTRKDPVPIGIISEISQKRIPSGHTRSFSASQNDARGDKIREIRCNREYQYRDSPR